MYINKTRIHWLWILSECERESTSARWRSVFYQLLINLYKWLALNHRHRFNWQFLKLSEMYIHITHLWFVGCITWRSLRLLLSWARRRSPAAVAVVECEAPSKAPEFDAEQRQNKTHQEHDGAEQRTQCRLLACAEVWMSGWTSWKVAANLPWPTYVSWAIAAIRFWPAYRSCTPDFYELFAALLPRLQFGSVHHVGVNRTPMSQLSARSALGSQLSARSS